MVQPRNKTPELCRTALAPSARTVTVSPACIVIGWSLRSQVNVNVEPVRSRIMLVAPVWSADSTVPRIRRVLSITGIETVVLHGLGEFVRGCAPDAEGLDCALGPEEERCRPDYDEHDDTSQGATRMSRLLRMPAS
jgi:hypothetical protein